MPGRLPGCPGRFDFRYAPGRGHPKETEDVGGDLVGVGDDPIPEPAVSFSL